MIIQQISIFAENSPGAIAEVLSVLAAVGVNAKAFAIADTSDFGIIRAIVDNTDKAATAARSAGFVVRVDDVFSVSFPDTPGSFCEVVKKLGNAGIDVKFSYAYATADGAQAIIGLDADALSKAVAIMHNA